MYPLSSPGFGNPKKPKPPKKLFDPKKKKRLKGPLGYFFGVLCGWTGGWAP